MADPDSFFGDWKLVLGCDSCLFLESARASIQKLIGVKKCQQRPKRMTLGSLKSAVIART